MSYKVYSFKDHRVIVNYPALGRYNLSDAGIGKITIAFAADLASVTATLDGQAIINKHHGRNGTIQIEIPQVGDANDYMDRWTNHAKNSPTANFADAEIMVIDGTGKTVASCVGVAPQKHADVVYDQDSQNRTWPLLVAELEIQ